MSSTRRLAACLDASADALFAPAPRPTTDRDRQLIALRLASPHRAGSGRTIVGQADAAHLALFVCANEPTLI